MFGDTREVPRSGLSFWDVALAVCIGVLAANFITWAVVEVRIRRELASVAESAERGLRDARDRVQAEQRLQLERQARAEQLQRDQLAAQQRAEELARQAKEAEVLRREQAWKRFYRPSPGCAEASTEVRCINEHLKAKTLFEAQYSAGKL